MPQTTKQLTVPLSSAGIDQLSEQLRQFLASRKVARRDIARYALTVEEILLSHLAQGGEAGKATLTVGSRLLSPFVTLEIEGAPNNAYASVESEKGVLAEGLLQHLGLSPEYVYKGQTNVYRFRIRKKRFNPFVSLLIALAAATAVGLLGMLLPEQARTLLQTNVLDPLHEAFLHMLGCLAGPMVFLSVAWGIYGIGDAATLKKIGKRLMLRYAGTVFLCLLLGAAIALPLLRPVFSGSESAGSAAFIFSMLLDIIPKNVVSPFVEGNTLQIIFMAVIFGIALLFLGQKTNAVAKAIEQINYVIQFIIEFISKLVPYFIFIVLVGMFWSDTVSVFGDLRSLFLVFLLALLVCEVLILILTALHNRVNPLLLVRKGLPTLIIALSTASSAAAFGSNLKACKREYGVDETVSSFGIPLGMVLFKPATSLSYLVMAVFFACMYGVEISFSWVVMMIFSAGVLAMATPPIPGGAMTAYTVLFTQLGIPPEAVAIALTCDALFDFITTGFDQFSLPFGLLSQASRLGLVNRKILTRPAETAKSNLWPRKKNAN